MNNIKGQHTTDRDLVDRVLKDEINVFGIIIKNTENLAAKIIFEMIINDGDRKDIAQDVYLKAYEKLPGLNFNQNFLPGSGKYAITHV